MTNFVEPAVHLLAWTRFDAAKAFNLTGWTVDDDTDPTGGQALAEFAGRSCFQSWKKPRPETSTNAGYLANILRQNHESVVEHATATFYVTGVSRSLLTELTRHRHLSLSVVSQRYVDESDARMVRPPAADSNALIGGLLDDVDSAANIAYVGIVTRLTEQGMNRKQAREAARAVLPNMTETRFVVTGNLRAWRDVLRRRWHVAADAEIRRFAGLILAELRELAPNVFQDFPAEPFGTGE
ncbi:FAD-dependent thymidylate synthase [Micromonospora sp. NPDC049081]|uniref:FAD-dependent thymidylate synthase n=1 Tax=Micromonospora sp. NPDC049081 TaxID=3155150 RepID=UPI00340A4BF6